MNSALPGYLAFPGRFSVCVHERQAGRDKNYPRLLGFGDNRNKTLTKD